MIRAYDIAVKKLIETFTNKIPVIGLQNQDQGDIGDSIVNQLGKDSQEDKIPFPVISVFRNPEIKITDGALTKRASTAEGYSWEDDQGRAISLVAMRSTLSYTIDVFDVSRAAAEEIALKLYFRLRNNPEIHAIFRFDDLIDFEQDCKAEIQMNDEIVHQRMNDTSKSQAYKIRMSFNLVNANIFDVIIKDYPTLNYEIVVKFKEEVQYQ